MKFLCGVNHVEMPVYGYLFEFWQIMLLLSGFSVDTMIINLR